MFIFMSCSLVAYVFAVAYYMRKFSAHIVRQVNNRVEAARQAYQRFLDRKEDLFIEKTALEGEAFKIFTLYEITREITSSLREEDAFKIFKAKLTENVAFADILFVPENDGRINEWKKTKEYWILHLQGKEEGLGALAVKGLNPEDKENFMIMANQFALALRRVKLHEEIERIAITDSLTELYTRHYFMGRLEEELKRSKLQGISTGLLMIDVDFFKRFNDQYGHLTGDQILRVIGGVIKESIREIDIAGRFGGEEFCVVLPDTSSDGAQYVAERIRSEVEKKLIKAYDTTHQVTASIGISAFPVDGKNTEELLDKADWALYRAKKKGRNRICAFGVYED